MNVLALEVVRREVSELGEALIYHQELDHAYTKYYTRVCERRATLGEPNPPLRVVSSSQLRVYHGRRNDA